MTPTPSRPLSPDHTRPANTAALRPATATALRPTVAPKRVPLHLAGAVWGTLGAAQCAQSYFLAHAQGRSWSLGGALLANMPWWIVWFALTPVVGVVAQRFPFGTGRSGRSLVAHLLAGMSLAGVQLCIVAPTYWFTTGRALGIASSWQNQLQRFFGSFFLESVITYAGVAGVFVAIDFARAWREEELRSAELRARAAALEATVAQSRLDVLRMELNPHFLFNTLNAISGLIGQRRVNEAQEVVGRLGDLLRHTLDRGPEQFTTVAREVELLEHFLFIEHVRFSDRLNVEIKVDEQAVDHAMPSMLLQPLVENAIRHGIEPERKAGDVHVAIDRFADDLRIVVSDSGRGFTLVNGRPAREGIGIANTRTRLEQLYGSRASLTLGNGATGGAVVMIRLPFGDSE